MAGVAYLNFVGWRIEKNTAHKKPGLPAGFFNQLLAGSFRESSSLGDDFMHPENTTHPSLPQETSRQPPLMETVAHEFSTQGALRFCTTISGVPCSDAINFASAILHSASRVCAVLIDLEREAAGLHAVMILIDQAKALVDSAVPCIEQAEDFAPQSQSSLDRGAEVPV